MSITAINEAAGTPPSDQGPPCPTCGTATTIIIGPFQDRDGQYRRYGAVRCDACDKHVRWLPWPCPRCGSADHVQKIGKPGAWGLKFCTACGVEYER